MRLSLLSCLWVLELKNRGTDVEPDGESDEPINEDYPLRCEIDLMTLFPVVKSNIQ